MKIASPKEVERCVGVAASLAGISDMLADISDMLADISDMLADISDMLADISDTEVWLHHILTSHLWFSAGGGGRGWGEKAPMWNR